MGNSQNSAATSNPSNANSLHHHHQHQHQNQSNLKFDTNNSMIISPPLTNSLGFASSPSPLTRFQHLQQNAQFNNTNQTSSHSNSSNSNTSSSSTSTKRKTKSKDSLLNSSFETNLSNINFIDACSLIGNLFII